MQPNPPSLAADPRRGLRSCSNLHRDENCRGAHAAGKHAEQNGDAPQRDAIADSGTLIHRYLETGADDDLAALSNSQQETANRIEVQKHALITEWMSPSGSNMEHFHELRLGLTEFDTVVIVTNDTRAALIGTGMADLIVLDAANRRAIIMDWKTGWLDVAPAAVNEQLRGLAVLAALKWNLKEVRVAIVHPMKGAPTVADFNEETLALALEWLKGVWSDDSDSLTAGDWCHYCPARSVCGAFREHATSLPDALEMETLPAGNELSAATARALELPNDELARLLKARKALNWFTGAIESAARIRLERGEIVPGFELRDKNGKRKIKDAQAAANAVAHLLEKADGGSAAALLRCADLRAAALTEEIQAASGRKLKKDGTPAKVGWNLSGTEAKAVLAEALGDLLEIPTSKALVETGAAIGGGEEGE